MVREPVVAGQFYSGKREQLERYLKDHLVTAGEKERVLAVLVPHAGYVYSGGVAAKVLSSVKIPETVILLGPNHTGVGTKASLYSAGSWKTPLGEVKIDETLAEKILNSSDLFKADTTAHEGEHSLEVILPFLQYQQPRLTIVPIAFMMQNAVEIHEVGEALGKVVQESDKEILIVVSSDMTHFESHATAMTKDAMAVEMLIELNPDGLLKVVATNSISMCGVIPAAIACHALKTLGGAQGEEIAYATSGEVSKDYDRVVGYSGMVFR